MMLGLVILILQVVNTELRTLAQSFKTVKLYENSIIPFCSYAMKDNFVLLKVTKVILGNLRPDGTHY